MVNFRYHIVSLVAVFLALGLGVLVGTTVIDQGIVKQLQKQTDGLDGRLSALQAQNDSLSRQQDVWNAFGASALLPSVKAKLNGRAVVIVSQDGTSARTIDGLVQTLADAGATLAGRVAITQKWALKDDAARQSLATAARVQAEPAPKLVEAVAARLGARLAQGGDPASQADLLGALRDAGFLGVDPTGAGTFPPPGAAVVLVASGVRGASPSQSQFFMPLLRTLAPSGRPIVVAEEFAAAESLAERVRSDATLRARISTVDDGDLILGRVALVSALRALTTGAGAQHYGARRSASALVPPEIA